MAFGWLRRAVRDRIAGSARAELDRRLQSLENSMRHVEGLMVRLHHFSMGSSATYVGNNRVLLRIVAGHHLFFLWVHADDKLIAPGLIVNGGYEPEVTEFFTRELRPDSNSIDVGANLGYFTCLIAKYSPKGCVIGIEPNPPLHALAVDNLILNGLHGPAQVLNVAASDRADELTLFRRIGRAGNTSITPLGEDYTRNMGEPPEEPFTVAAIRIDDLRERLSGRVDFLKIDVEGAEPLALRGARETIRANPQLQIVMEWAPVQIQEAGFDVSDFVREIAAVGLRPYLLDSHAPQAISHDELNNLIYQSGVLFRHDPA